MALGLSRRLRITEAKVLRVERPTPGTVRVVLGGPGLAGFPPGRYTDLYVKLLFPPRGVRYPVHWDLEQIRSLFSRHTWPSTRTYTVRRWDPVARELSVDVVQHGGEGLGDRWAACAEPGSRVRFLGPGGTYAPSPDADWHFLAGDETALPAIAASVEAMPPGAVARVFVEVSGPDEVQPVACPHGVRITWLYRGEQAVGSRLVDAVGSLDFPPGDMHAFIRGEAGLVRELRRHLLLERGVARERLSASGYWRSGHSDESWRALKPQWRREIETEEETGGAVA